MVSQDKPKSTRRKMLRYSGAGAVFALAGCLGGGNSGGGNSGGGNSSGGNDNQSSGDKDFKGQTLTVNGYGGDWKNLFRRVVANPFEKETGATVKLAPAGSASETYAKIKAQGGSPGFDLAVLTGAEILLGKQDNTLAKVPKRYTHVNNMIDRYAKIVRPYGAVHGVQFLSLFTHKTKNKGSSDSWETLWNKDNAGHVLLIKPSNLAGIFMTIQAAKMNGGSIKNMKPGFQKMSKLCPDQILSTIKSSSETFNYTNTESVWATPFWSGRALISIKKRDQPYEMKVAKEGAPYLTICLGVPKHAKNKDLAFEFMNFWLSPKINANWSENYHVGPTTPQAVKKLSKSARKLVPNPEMPNFDKLYYPNPNITAQNREAWTQKWNRQVGSKC